MRGRAEQSCGLGFMEESHDTVRFQNELFDLQNFKKPK